ncbi:MAG TPA: response regulator [Vicinamibacterales bacterium]|nr:response regulator [Vicinamibacterales bacterium]
MRRVRILIVEDDTDLRRLFRAVLSIAGFDVDEAADGPEALRVIDSKPPALVTLDLQLPTLDGVSVQQELAARARTCHIPIIIVTGSSIEVEGSNVSCVLRKPVSPDRLLHAVRQCLLRRSGSIV